MALLDTTPCADIFREELQLFEVDTWVAAKAMAATASGAARSLDQQQQEQKEEECPSRPRQRRVPLVATGAAGERLWSSARQALESPAFSSREGPLFVFDWDDTLLPTTMLFGEDCVADYLATSAAERRRQLAACTEAAVQVLRVAKQLGRVMIVTNGVQGWVEESSAKYAPGLVDELADVPVISARSVFEPQGVDEPVLWKDLAFQRIVLCLQAQSWLRGQGGSCEKQLRLVSIGDGPSEREAALGIAQDPSLSWRVTSLKLLECPSMNELEMQLALCAENLMHVLPRSGCMDLRMSDSLLFEVLPSQSDSGDDDCIE